MQPSVPSPVFTATKATATDTMWLHGRNTRYFAGDWIISRGPEVVDVVDEGRFRKEYQAVPLPTLSLAHADQQTIADLLGPAVVESSATLTQAIKRLVGLRIGDVAINFSIGQWEELARRAEKRRMALKDYLKQVIERLMQDLWTTTGV